MIAFNGGPCLVGDLSTLDAVVLFELIILVVPIPKKDLSATFFTSSHKVSLLLAFLGGFRCRLIQGRRRKGRLGLHLGT